MHRVTMPLITLALVVFAATGAHAVPVLVDFDALDASAARVSGAPLTAYLAGFGISISNVTPSSQVLFVTNANTPPLIVGIPNFFTPPSAPNFLFDAAPNTPISYELDFSTPQKSLSFTRVQLNANLSPSGLIAATWSARALDSGGKTVATVGEPQLASFGVIPAETFTLTGPGITALVVERTSVNAIAGLNAVPIDNLVLDPEPSVVPEPSTLVLLGTGLAWLGSVARRRYR